MKKQNKKLITLMLAGLCAVSLSTAVASTTAYADEAATTVTAATYAITDVFATNGTSGAEDTTVAFTLGNEQYARIKRDLAFKWYEAEGAASYLTVKFAFKELNFKSIVFEVESSSSVATKDNKTVNAVKFSMEEGKVYASIIHGDGLDKKESAKTELAITAGGEVTLALTQGSKFDSFGVKVNDVLLGDADSDGVADVDDYEFIHVGANYSKYSLEKMHPLEIKAEMEGEAKAVVLLNTLNGQSFNNVKDSKITDNAAPVLVVNEDLNGFQYGTAFALSYEKIDVLQGSGLKESKKYYQYNPADEKTNYDSTLTTSTYFMDTVYYTNGTDYSKEAKAGYTATSVRAEDLNGREYVSIQVTLGDDTYSDKKDSEGNIPFAQKVYDLSWYAADSAVVEKSLGGVATKYIVIDENDSGATYTHLEADHTNHVNKVTVDLSTQEQNYQDQINETAKGVYAGSNSDFMIPDVEWLIKDNGGYRNLKFTISYKTPSASSPKTASSLSYNNLEISTTEEGLYEFKIFANDKAGNTMKYYVDGELVSVSSSNIWDIKEIPSFTFRIDNLGIKVEEATSANSRKAEKILNETYTLSGLTVIGATNQQSDYALYRLDTTGYTGAAITQSALTGVKYEDIRSAAIELLDKVGTEEYPTTFDLYLDIYAGKVATAISGDKAAVKACFKPIKEFNSAIGEDEPEWEEYNKYNWNAASKNFKTVEEGEYLILADFWEKELPLQRASAYKVVIVETEEDVAEGESKTLAWLRNNKVSVILFGVAGLMLILIIILLLIKPSDETLDDVDKEAAKKKDKKSEKKDK